MAKGDDTLLKKKNKVIRKRARRFGGSTPEAKNAVEASRFRRKAGVRRTCEGMCYTLPTPDDPFNDRHGKARRKHRGKNNDFEMQTAPLDNILDSGLSKKSSLDEKVRDANKRKHNSDFLHENKLLPSGATASAVMTRNTCLDVSFELITDYIAKEQEADSKLLISVIEKKDMYKKLQLQCWEAHDKGRDILGTCESIDRKFVYVPFVASYTQKQVGNLIAVILVASREQALTVRKLFKPLKKALNIHAVSLHAGVTIQHQVDGLKSCMPEILVATPKRLWELHRIKAVNLLNVSLLVIDSLREILANGFSTELEDIIVSLKYKSLSLVFSGSFSADAIAISRKVMERPIQRLLVDFSLEEDSACIVQEAFVIISDNKKLQKVVRLLNQINETGTYEVLVVLKELEVKGFVASMGKKGFLPEQGIRFLKLSKGDLQLIVIAENKLEDIDISRLDTAIVYGFSSIQSYCTVLTRIARDCASGVVYSFCSPAMASIASQFINILVKCSQPVPSALSMLSEAASLVATSGLINLRE